MDMTTASAATSGAPPAAAFAVATDTALAARTASAPRSTTDPKAAHATAMKFEGMFLSQMLSLMWADVPTDGMFGGGHGEEMFRSLLINEYGKAIARSGGLGIASSVERVLLHTQEV